MSSALHAVPGPDPDDGPGPGEWPPPAAPPVLSPAEDAPAGPVDQDQEEGERPVVGRALAIPDLTPYLDVRALAELGPLAVEAGRAGAPKLLHALRAAARFLITEARRFGAAQLAVLRGLFLLGQFLTRWLTGEVGKRGTVGARIGGSAFLAYGIVHGSLTHPAVPWLVLAAVAIPATLVGVGRIALPQPKAAEKKTDGKQSTAKNSSGRTAGEKAPEPGAAGDSKSTGKKAAKASRLGALRGLIPGRRQAPGEDPEQAEDAPPAEEAAATPGRAEQDPPAEAAPAAPRSPSQEALVRALNPPDRGGKGVLLTTVQKALNLPDTRAVKRVLEGAGIRWRDGVRTTAGNGPGVHPSDIPPLPPAPATPQGSGVGAGQDANANANNNNTANAPGQLDDQDADSWIGPTSGDLYTRTPGANPGAWTITPKGRP